VSTSYSPAFFSGKQVTGKWHGRAYSIERGLGEGANGKVYLVRRDNAAYAMKIGSDTLDLQAEVNVLKILSGMEGSFRDFLMDVDDYRDGGKDIPFYVMKYVEGRQPQDYLAAKGKEWFPLVGLRLLDKLRELHTKGYVFGDLKKENILVSGYGQVELVDFGGVTPMGKAVKQFTELYDRGYWNAGERSADMGYDLFSFAILCIHLCGGPKQSFAKGVLPQNRNLDELLSEVEKDPLCADYLPFLRKALRGGYSSSAKAVEDWRHMVRERSGIRLPAVSSGAPFAWVKVGFAASLLLFAATVWYYW
jgi:serine/threonine protein kinase